MHFSGCERKTCKTQMTVGYGDLEKSGNQRMAGRKEKSITTVEEEPG